MREAPASDAVPDSAPSGADTGGGTGPFSAELLDHCNHPRNVGSFAPGDASIGTGWAEAVHCQDVVKLQIRVAGADRIVEARFKTFGCSTAIACSSLATELVTGATLDEALDLDCHTLGRRLSLSSRRLECAGTVERAVRLAVADYREKVED